MSRTQILRSLTGVTPIRSFANIGGGFAEMVLEPLKQYRTGGDSQQVFGGEPKKQGLPRVGRGRSTRDALEVWVLYSHASYSQKLSRPTFPQPTSLRLSQRSRARSSAASSPS